MKKDLIKMAKKSPPTPASKEVFISHATVDKPLADAFVDLLQMGLDISDKKILCTSLEGLGIPKGGNFVNFIGETMQNAQFVIMLITPAYFESPFCLCELGASWALKHDIYPLIVPPLQYDSMKAVLNGIQAGYINENSTLDEMHDRLIKLGVGDSNTPRWTAKRDSFTKNFLTIQQQLKSSTVVPIKTYENVVATYKSAQEIIAEKDTAINILNQKINRLKECKGQEEVSQVEREFSTEHEAFERLVDEFKNALKHLSTPAKTALYYLIRREDWAPYSGFNCDASMWDDIRNSVQRGYISNEHQFESACRQNKAAFEKFKQLIKFINSLDDENSLIEEFGEEHDFPLDLKNRDFWENYLCVNLYQ